MRFWKGREDVHIVIPRRPPEEDEETLLYTYCTTPETLPVMHLPVSAFALVPDQNLGTERMPRPESRRMKRGR